MFSQFLSIPCSSERKKELEDAILKYYEENPWLWSQNMGSMRDYVCCELYTPEEWALYECPELQRFIKAHQIDFDTALNEVKTGHKQTHWIWYILPQMKGLGHSEMSEYYGIADRREATAYLRHTTLRNHLIEMAKAISENSNTVYEIFDNDAVKVRSCFLLFNSIEPIPEIQKVISMYNWH